MTEKENMVAGRPFLGSDPELMEDKKKARIFCEELNRSPEDDALREGMVKDLFGKTGKHLRIKPPFRCDYGYRIFVGENFFANFDCVFLDAGPIIIGDNTMIGPKTCIYASTHELDPEERKKGYTIPKGVRIGSNVWVGGQVSILPGVTIGDNCIIGAGSVVTKSFPDNVVIAGNPARIIKEL